MKTTVQQKNTPPAPVPRAQQSALVDNRPEALAQRALSRLSDDSMQLVQLRALAAAINRAAAPASKDAAVIQMHKVVSDPQKWAEPETVMLFNLVPELVQLRQDLIGIDVENWTWDLKARCIEVVRAFEGREQLIGKYIVAENQRLAQYGLRELDPAAIEDHIVMIASRIRWTLKVLGSGEFPPDPGDVNLLPKPESKENREETQSTTALQIATELVAQGDSESIQQFVLALQQERANSGPAFDSAEAEKAELLCLGHLRLLKHEPPKEIPIKPSQKGTLIPAVGGAFHGALELCLARSQHLWTDDQERLVLLGLQQATQNLLSFVALKSISNPGVVFPALQDLHQVGDLVIARELMLQTMPIPNEDDYSHAFEVLFPEESESDEDVRKAMVDSHSDRDQTLAPRLHIRVCKAADTWLKYATPYVQLKCAFLDGWEPNEHGRLLHRVFYYLLTRDPEKIAGEIAGDSDSQAGIVEPVSAKVSLALALQDVYNTAACHADALQLVKLLGGSVCAKGVLREKDGGNDLLSVMKLMIFNQVMACRAPMVGLRLRDSGHHSLVLLFEAVDAFGLLGSKFETVAGQNTEEILYFMESGLPLKSAWKLIDEGIPKAIQQTRPGWVLEWEVFTVAAPGLLQENIDTHIGNSVKGINTGLERHHKGGLKTKHMLSFMLEDDGRFEWDREAEEHVNSLAAGKQEYLRLKEARRLEALAARQVELQDRENAVDQFKQALADASGNEEKITEILRQVYAQLGDAVFDIAMNAIGMKFEKVLKLLPELAEL